MNIYNVLGLIGFCVISISAKEDLKRPGKVIIDTDGGGDDASAILLALATEKQSTNHDFEVIAITCTYGNTNLENVEQNVRKILTIAGRTDIPVYSGAAEPLINTWKPDFLLWSRWAGRCAFQTSGQWNNRSIKARKCCFGANDATAQNVSIFALGPLTNIALAIKLDANFVHNVERFYIMGASVTGVGNIAPAMEFNFYEDPHSNFIVLNSIITDSPAVLFPWETTLRANVAMSWRTDVLGALDSPAIRFMNEIERKHFKGEFWEVADVMLTALALWPNLIKSCLLTNLTPIYDGAGQGSVIIDYKNITHKPPNVEILSEFDVAAFKKTLLDSFEIK